MSPHSHASSGNRYSQAQLKICRTGTTLGYGEAQAQAFLSSVAQQSLGRAQIPAAVQEATLLPAAQPIAGRVWRLAGAALGTQGSHQGIVLRSAPLPAGGHQQAGQLPLPWELEEESHNIPLLAS